MTRQRSSILICTLVATISVSAQTVRSNAYARMLDDAGGLLTAERWEDAAKVYRRLEIMDSTSAEVAYGLGVCLGQIPGQRTAATEHFARASRYGHLEAKYQLALVLHRQQRFDEALALLAYYKSAAEHEVPDAEVDRQVRMVATARELQADPVQVNIANMGPRINSKDNDYSPVTTADGATLYFTSRRKGSTG